MAIYDENEMMCRTQVEQTNALFDMGAELENATTVSTSSNDSTIFDKVKFKCRTVVEQLNKLFDMGKELEEYTKDEIEDLDTRLTTAEGGVTSITTTVNNLSATVGNENSGLVKSVNDLETFAEDEAGIKLSKTKVGTNITIGLENSNEETISSINFDVGEYTLPTASSSTLGGVKIGDNIIIDSDGKVSVNTGSMSTKGVVTGSTSVRVDSDGAMYLEPFTTGCVPRFGSIASIPTPSGNYYGAVFLWDGYTQNGYKQGRLYRCENVEGGSYEWREIDSYLQFASNNTAGMIKVGNNLSIDSNGVLSADAQPYDLPTASSTVKGGVKVGTNLSIDSNSILSVDGCEIISNKVISVSSSSTDIQYPSAKCMYDELSTRLPSSKCTYQTTAPTSAITDGGVHIVFLWNEPTTKYAGYIYLIAYD